MAVIENSGEIRSIVGSDFSLIFERTDDRWTHAIAVDGDPIALSVEWYAERDDPGRVVSPVFQEIHFQTNVAGNHQALLVGMSGGHHFSAVFVLTEAESGSSLAVDVADRSRSEVIGLASTYTVMLNSSDLAEADDAAVAWNLAACQLRFQAGPATHVGVGEAGRRATGVQAWIEGAVIPSTYRWRYEWQLSRSPSP